MNIVFFGTNEFSAKVAESILNSKHKILAIVAQPDKVNSRGGKVKFNALKQFAIDNNIPIHQFAKLNIEGEEILRKYNADFFVTASYGQIIRQNILDLPKYSIVNGLIAPKISRSSAYSMGNNQWRKSYWRYNYENRTRARLWRNVFKKRT